MFPAGAVFRQQARQVNRTIVEILGATVDYVGMEPGTYGRTYPDGYASRGIARRTIQVDESLDWTARLMVLAHEAGHLMEPDSLNKVEGEVFAEAVGYLVCRHYGLDDPQAHARYLASYKSGFHVFEDWALEIDYAVRVLTSPADWEKDIPR